MGIDHYNCDNCEKSFADVEGYSVCENCNNYYCSTCRDDIKRFHFQNKDYCELCWEDEPESYNDEELLEYMLKKHKTTKKKLKKELPEKQAKHYYFCEDTSHKCGSKQCERIDKDLENVLELPIRGICCVSFYDNEKNINKYCEACKKANKKN